LPHHIVVADFDCPLFLERTLSIGEPAVFACFFVREERSKSLSIDTFFGNDTYQRRNLLFVVSSPNDNNYYFSFGLFGNCLNSIYYAGDCVFISDFIK
jgi:hypothetical protein